MASRRAQAHNKSRPPPRRHCARPAAALQTRPSGPPPSPRRRTPAGSRAGGNLLPGLDHRPSLETVRTLGTQGTRGTRDTRFTGFNLVERKLEQGREQEQLPPAARGLSSVVSSGVLWQPCFEGRRTSKERLEAGLKAVQEEEDDRVPTTAGSVSFLDDRGSSRGALSSGGSRGLLPGSRGNTARSSDRLRGVREQDEEWGPRPLPGARGGLSRDLPLAPLPLEALQAAATSARRGATAPPGGCRPGGGGSLSAR